MEKIEEDLNFYKENGLNSFKKSLEDEIKSIEKRIYFFNVVNVLNEIEKKLKLEPKFFQNKGIDYLSFNISDHPIKKKIRMVNLSILNKKSEKIHHSLPLDSISEEEVFIDKYKNEYLFLYRLLGDSNLEVHKDYCNKLILEKKSIKIKIDIKNIDDFASYLLNSELLKCWNYIKIKDELNVNKVIKKRKI